MTDDLKERLGVYGQPGKRGSDHPHSVVCRDALAHITDLEARLAAAEADVNRLREGEARLSLLLNETALARDAAEAENIRLKRQVETLKTGWGIADRDRIKAEAGEDALAEALRITRERLMDAVHSEFDGVWSAEDFNEQEAEAAAALAAYEVRRKG